MFDKLDVKKTGELSMSDVCIAYFQFTNSMLTISDLYSIMDVSNHTNPEDVRINFEQFCAIIAEFTGNCNNTSTRIEGANRFIYWKLAMYRTQQLLRIYIVRPIVNIIGSYKCN